MKNEWQEGRVIEGILVFYLDATNMSNKEYKKLVDSRRKILADVIKQLNTQGIVVLFCPSNKRELVFTRLTS